MCILLLCGILRYWCRRPKCCRSTGGKSVKPCRASAQCWKLTMSIYVVLTLEGPHVKAENHEADEPRVQSFAARLSLRKTQGETKPSSLAWPVTNHANTIKYKQLWIHRDSMPQIRKHLRMTSRRPPMWVSKNCLPNLPRIGDFWPPENVCLSSMERPPFLSGEIWLVRLAIKLMLHGSTSRYVKRRACGTIVCCVRVWQGHPKTKRSLDLVSTWRLRLWLGFANLSFIRLCPFTLCCVPFLSVGCRNCDGWNASKCDTCAIRLAIQSAGYHRIVRVCKTISSIQAGLAGCQWKYRGQTSNRIYSVGIVLLSLRFEYVRIYELPWKPWPNLWFLKFQVRWRWQRKCCGECRGCRGRYSNPVCLSWPKTPTIGSIPEVVSSSSCFLRLLGTCRWAKQPTSAWPRLFSTWMDEWCVSFPHKYHQIPAPFKQLHFQLFTCFAFWRV